MGKISAIEDAALRRLGESNQWDWPARSTYYEITCNRCWTLSSTLTWDDAFAVAAEDHRGCHPGGGDRAAPRCGAGQRQNEWSIWLHTGE
jgi:hypothetical protein